MASRFAILLVFINLVRGAGIWLAWNLILRDVSSVGHLDFAGAFLLALLISVGRAGVNVGGVDQVDMSSAELMEAAADRISVLEHEHRTLREALADAVAAMDAGRTSQIGKSRVVQPQIQVRTIVRLRKILEEIPD